MRGSDSFAFANKLFSFRLFVVYNSLGQPRNEIVCVHTDTTKVDVRDEKDVSLPLQVGPIIFKDRGRMEVSSTVFEVCCPKICPYLFPTLLTFQVCWHATVPPVSVTMFRIFRNDKASQENLAVVRSSIGSLPSG